MKISPQTIEILKNFSSINNSILIQQGHEFYTRDVSRTILAQATVQEYFDNEMGIFDLSSMLQYFRLCKDPDIETQEDSVLISGNGTKIKYRLADKTNIVCQEVPFNISETPFATIKFTQDVLETIKAAANIGVTKADTVEYRLKDGVTEVRVFNSENSATNEATKVLDATVENATEFGVQFKTDVFLMLPGDYVLELYTREKGGQTMFFANYVGEFVKYITPAKANGTYLKV